MNAIEMSGITKRFGAVIANDAAGCSVSRGEIHTLVGENGAGKSTLMRILYGMYRPDSGEIRVEGTPFEIRSPADAISRGIGMVHQHFMLVPPLTVAENIILGAEPMTSRRTIALKRAESEIRDLAESCGLPVDPRARIHELSVGLQQRVEILKLLYRRARILILDEPTPVLTPQETEDLFRTLRSLRDGGMTIILITHKLREVLSLSDSVTVMRKGRTVGHVRTSDTSKQELARMMVGHDIEFRAERASVKNPGAVLDVRECSALNDRRLPALRGVSFTVQSGEILGVAGVEGNGQSELVQVLTGLRHATAGRILINSSDITNRHPGRLVSHIPEDRLHRGIVLPFTLVENLMLGRQKEPSFSGRMLLRTAEIARQSAAILKQFDVRPPDPLLRVKQLSGGNQQKLVLGRELGKNAPVIIASQPTRGLDIGAINSIHTMLMEERNRGKAVLLVSSDLEELLLLSDRIIVLYEGAIVARLETASATEELIGLYMTGSAAPQAS